MDGRGQFVMPGLADMRMHLAFECSPDSAKDNRAPFAHGVTSVRGLWGAPETGALRDRAKAGEVLARRIWTSGPARYLRQSGLADGPVGLSVAPADLVLLRADPLFDVANKRQIKAVGRRPDRAHLDALLDQARQIYAQAE